MEHIVSCRKLKHSALHSTLFISLFQFQSQSFSLLLFLTSFPAFFCIQLSLGINGRFIQEPLCMPKSVDAHVSQIKWQGTRNTVSALHPWTLHPRIWRANHSIFNNTLGLVNNISVCLRKKMKYVCVCACMHVFVCMCVLVMLVGYQRCWN